MTRVQILEMDGQATFAVVPIELWERVRELLEDADDARAFDEALAADDGFRIPLEVVKNEFEQGMHPVRAWREFRRLSQDELALQAGISKAYLSQIENGRRRGSTATMGKLAGALGVPMAVLLGGGERRSG